MSASRCIDIVIDLDLLRTWHNAGHMVECISEITKFWDMFSKAASLTSVQ